MGSYIVRRVLASLLILLAASFLMFALVTLSGDPLAEFTGSNAPDKERLIQERIQTLNLDEPFPRPVLPVARGSPRLHRARHGL